MMMKKDSYSKNIVAFNSLIGKGKTPESILKSVKLKHSINNSLSSSLFNETKDFETKDIDPTTIPSIQETKTIT